MNTMNEATFVQTICAQLDASIADLDPALVDRLHRMRRAALLPVSASAIQGCSGEDLLPVVLDTLNQAPPLAPDIHARLDSARKLAVASMQQRNASPVQSFVAWIRFRLDSLLDSSRIAQPARVLATACVLVTVVSLSYVASFDSTGPSGTLPMEDEIALIASAEDFELVENLEFYLWLAENGLPN